MGMVRQYLEGMLPHSVAPWALTANRFKPAEG